VENFQIIEETVSRYFTIKNFSNDLENPYFILEDYDAEKFDQLNTDMGKIGYIAGIDEEKGNFILKFAEKKLPEKSRHHINVILFVITVATTIYAGYIFGGGSIVDGIAFSVAIMAIIGTHETAHYFAAKKYGVEATLPYFIPAPTLIGTFGAVINVKSPIPSRNALFDLGASGPLAGIIVTIPVLFIGIFISSVVPMKAGSIVFTPPLLMSIIGYFAAPSVPDGYMLQIHAVAFAGWVGVVVTMLNLMPVAFLDGGHISRSIFNQKIHKIMSFFGIVITMVLGWIPMAFLMAIIMIMTKQHPGALNNVSKLSKSRKILSVVLIFIFILCLAPVPLPLI
jgi:membrane-associated protease RseP (regulator of RpoE activity)